MNTQKNEELKPEVKDLETVFEQVLPEDETKEEVVEELTDEELARMVPKNTPYVKIKNSEGDLVNPITKADPYINFFMGRRQRKALLRKATKHPKNNKKGIRLLVTKFAKGKFLKTNVVKQNIKAKTVLLADLETTGEINYETKVHKAKTLIHNQIQL